MGMAHGGRAFTAASESAPESIRWILFSEIVLQAAAMIHTGQFQRQKLIRIGGEG